MESTQERKVERVPWLPLIVIIALASIIGSAVFLFLGSAGEAVRSLQCTYNWGIASRTTTLAVLPFILPMLAYPFRKLLKINAASLTYLYTIGTVMAYSSFGGTEAGLLIPINISSTVLFTSEAIRNAMGSWWWVPPYDVMEATMAGGLAVNWVSWAGAIFFWMTFNLSLFLFSSGLSLVFRKRWLDVEEIPFPMTMAAHQVIRAVDVNRSADRDLRPLVAGMVLGLVFEVPIFLQAIYPWFPDIYGWRTLTCPGGTQQFSETNPLAQNIVGLAMVSKDPVAFGLFFLAPLSVSFNVWFWSLVMFVLMQIAYSMGYYTGIFSISGCCRSWTISTSSPFYLGYTSGIGGATAIAAMILFNSRHYLRETLGRAFSSHSSISDTEKVEATSYRTAYLILAAGAVAVLLWQLSAGIEFLTALSILIFTIFIGGVSGFYIFAHTGFGGGTIQGNAAFPIVVRFANQAIPSLTEPDMIMSGFLNGMISNVTILMQFPTAQMMPFKMASLTGTSNRNTFLVAAVTVLIATPLILMTKIWIVSIYGNQLVSQHYGCGIDSVCAGQTPIGTGISDFPLLLEYGSMGFVITFAIAMLHSRFVWFPFEPLGFVIATGLSGNFYGVWSAFLGAWIIKTLVLRVGGSKLYERSIPIVGGLLAGVFIGIFAGSLIITFKFFVPF